jgi:hypothetical protein
MVASARRTADVGPIVAEFRPRPFEVGAMLATALVLALVGISFASAAVGLPRLSGDTRLMVGLVGVLIAATAVQLAWRGWRRRALRVLVGRDGLQRRWRGRDEAYRWAEVILVEESEADEGVDSIEIEFLDGNLWEIDAGLADFDRLRALIADRPAG